MHLFTSTRIGSTIIALLLGLGVAACSDDPASSNVTENGTVSAKVNGESWSATNVQATWTSNVLGIGGAAIAGANNRQINISGLVAAPGTYQLNALGGLIATYTEGSAANVQIFTATAGTLKVDELTSGGAKGSFSFDAANSQGGGTRSVTEGTFDITF